MDINTSRVLSPTLLSPLSLLSSWLTLQSLTSDWLNKDCLSLRTLQRYRLLKSDPENSLRSDGLHSFKSVLVQWPHKQLGCSLNKYVVVVFFVVVLNHPWLLQHVLLTNLFTSHRLRGKYEMRFFFLRERRSLFIDFQRNAHEILKSLRKQNKHFVTVLQR